MKVEGIILSGTVIKTLSNAVVHGVAYYYLVAKYRSIRVCKQVRLDQPATLQTNPGFKFRFGSASQLARIL